MVNLDLHFFIFFQFSNLWRLDKDTICVYNIYCTHILNYMDGSSGLFSWKSWFLRKVLLSSFKKQRGRQQKFPILSTDCIFVYLSLLNIKFYFRRSSKHKTTESLILTFFSGTLQNFKILAYSTLCAHCRAQKGCARWKR